MRRKLSKPALHTESSFKDGEAISRLEVILNMHKLVKPALNKGDTWPNHDGFLEVLVNGSPKGTIFTQVKTLNSKRMKTKICYRFKNDKFLSFCRETRENPILFIGVDLIKKVAYW